MKFIKTVFALTLLAASAAAQIKNPVANALKDIFPNRQKNTIAAVEMMPADKFTYKPSADQNTFAHLVVHMIGTNYLLCGNAAGLPAPTVEEPKDTDGKDKLIAALKASFKFCDDAIAKIDDSKLGEVATGPDGTDYSRARYALGIASNWADHYAQVSMYLRLNGLTPPATHK